MTRAHRSGWLDIAESGGLLGLRIFVWVATAFGRGPVGLLLRAVVLYYALVHRKAMRASGAFFERLGLPHGFWAGYRHVLHFAQCTVDRMFFIQGKVATFRIETHGSEHLFALARAGKGAVLLGAHLGSFEAMHATAGAESLAVNVVGYFGNAARINTVLRALGPGLHTRLIEVRPGDINVALQLRECVERGEFVAILADRSVAGHVALVDFFGARAEFPTGPYALAAALKCPVLLTFGLYTAPNRYDLYCEPFAERVTAPRAQREQALQGHAQRFATRLEHYCRLAPDNWFNFYDFWSHRA